MERKVRTWKPGIIKALSQRDMSRETLIKAIGAKSQSYSDSLKRLLLDGVIQEVDCTQDKECCDHCIEKSKRPKRGPKKSGNPSKCLTLNPDINGLKKVIESHREVISFLHQNDKIIEMLVKDIRTHSDKDFLIKLIKTNPNFFKWIIENYEELICEWDMELIVEEERTPFRKKLELESFLSNQLSEEGTFLLGRGGLPEHYLTVLWYDTQKYGEFEVDLTLKKKAHKALELAHQINELTIETEAIKYVLDIMSNQKFEEQLRPIYNKALNEIRALKPVKNFDDLLRVLAAHHLMIASINSILDTFLLKRDGNEEPSLEKIISEMDLSPVTYFRK